MAEVPDTNVPPDRDGQGGQKSTPYRQRHKFRKNRKKKPESTKTSFKGPIPGYETYVYNISRNKGPDAFSATTRKLPEYISRTVPNAGESMNAMNAMNPDELGFQSIEEPEDPENGATTIQLEKWNPSTKIGITLPPSVMKQRKLRTLSL